jgi:hypothetical protein
MSLPYNSSHDARLHAVVWEGMGGAARRRLGVPEFDAHSLRWWQVSLYAIVQSRQKLCCSWCRLCDELGPPDPSCFRRRRDGGVL